MSEDRESLDKFGRFLMEHLRDRCIEHFDRLAEGRWKAPALLALQASLAALGEQDREVARRAVVSGIDSAIHDFLFKLQERADFADDIQVIVDGKSLVPMSDGVHGELFGRDGWRARFSRYGEGADEP